MDPASAIGVASSVTGFLSFIKDAVEVINDIKSAGEDYKNLQRRLEILAESLQSVKNRVDEVATVKREVEQGPYGIQTPTDTLFQRYEEAMATTPKGPGLFLQTKACLDKLLDDEFKKAVSMRKRDKLMWTWKKGDLNRKLDDAIEMVRTLRDFLSDDDVHLQHRTFVTVMKTQRSLEENAIVQILDWISPPQFQPTNLIAAKHSSVLPIPDPFVVSDPVYKQWLHDASTIHWQLNCFGMPGSGKSHRARTVIYDLDLRFRRKQVPVLFILFSNANEAQQSLRAVYRTFLRQLLSQRSVDKVPADIRDLYNRGSLRGQDGPTEAEARHHLIEELKKHKSKFIVTDALDEAKGCLQTIHGALNNLRREAGATIFSTTRLDPTEMHSMTIGCDMCSKLMTDLYWTCLKCTTAMSTRIDICRQCYMDKGKRCNDPTHDMTPPETVNIEVSPTRREIEAFVRSSLKKMIDMTDQSGSDDARFAGFAPPIIAISKSLGQVWDTIPRLVGAVADENYLVADLIVKRLVHQKSLEGAKKVLSSLQAGTTVTYDDQYADMLDLCLNRRGRESGKIAYDFFAFISCVQVPLSFSQLSHAIAVKEGDETIDNFAGRFWSQQTVRIETNGMLVIGDFGNPEHERVSVFHRTLLEYFRENGEKWFPDRNQLMFNACMSYLELEPFRQPFQDPAAIDKTMEEYTFAAYAACFWGHHLRNIPKKPPGERDDNVIRVLELFNDTKRKTAIVQISLNVLANADVAWDVQRDVSLLHIFAFQGLADICQLLLDDGECIDCLEESYGQSALHYACRKGHMDVIHVLLGANANPNIVSDKHRTPLMEAIENNHLDAVDLLLKNPYLDVNADVGGKRKLTTLIFAAENNKAEAVQKLLQHDKIQINKCDSTGGTALMYAVRWRNVECVKLLLQHPQIDLTLASPRTGSALEHIVIGSGPDDEMIINLFLQKGAPVLGGQALRGLIETRRNGLVKLLLQGQTYSDWKDDHGRSLMHIAATCGSDVQTVQLIFDNLSSTHQFDIDAQDAFGCTSLHAACRRLELPGGPAIATLLLTLGANVLIKNKDGDTAVEVAFKNIPDSLRNTVKTLFLPYLPQGTDLLSRNPSMTLERIIVSGDMNKLEATLQLEPMPLRSTPDPYTGWNMLHLTMYTNSSPIQERPDMLRVILPKALPLLNNLTQASRSPLHVAAFRNCKAAVDMLVSAGAELDLKDKWEQTAFDLAQARNSDLAFVILNAGAHVPKENLKPSLIHDAITSCNVEAVRRLVDIGVDVYEKKMGTGSTALRLARDLHRKAIEAAERDLINSTQWLSQTKFSSVGAFQQAARNTPRVKAHEEIIELLQKARRNPNRGRYMPFDFTSLIERLRSYPSSTFPSAPSAPPYKRSKSEQSPPPPYAAPKSAAPVHHNRPLLQAKGAKPRPTVPNAPVSHPAASNVAISINVKGVKIDLVKRDIFILLAMSIVFALASMWLILYYTVQLVSKTHAYSEL